MTVDYQELNKVTAPHPPHMQLYLILLDGIGQALGISHFVIDLANVFFSIASQDQVAFTWEEQQWTFTILLQGYLHSPTMCHGLVASDLQLW